MIGTLAELLTLQDIDTIAKLLTEDEIPFSRYVDLAGLDPTTDFRHADLRFLDLRFSDIRGYDFTGADLRFSIKDATTLEDLTTIYTDADLEWLTPEATPVFEQMQRVSRLDAGPSLRGTVGKMVDDHPFSTAHIDKFLLQEMTRSRSLDRFIELASSLSNSISLYEQPKASEVLSELILRKGVVPKRKQGMGTGVAIEKILRQLREGTSRFLREVRDRTDLAILRTQSGTRPGQPIPDTPSLWDLAEFVRLPQRAEVLPANPDKT